jgi:predicted ArsR family transcriptional regulator
MATWNERFFATTRGQVVALLRQGERTVDELARALDLTDNAVRAHLASLERDGLVRQAGLRRGASKPAFVYALTPAADRLFPKSYGTLMRLLLDALAKRLPPQEIDDTLREVGHRAAGGAVAPPGDLEERVRYGLAVLEELGGLATCEKRNGGFVIQGASCPLAEALPGHPEVCHLAETLLSDVIGAPVVEHCERGDPPRCCFEVLACKESA